MKWSDRVGFQQGVYPKVRELALFAGAGGGILGGKLIGLETLCAVENDTYCRDQAATT